MATITGSDNGEIIQGTPEADNISARAGGDTVFGGGGDDEITGGDGDDVLYGEEGDDQLFGDEGDDTLYGGDGDDTLTSSNGSDTLYGEAGNDFLYGQRESDFLDGGADNDYLVGDAGDDELHGGDGDDRLFGGFDNDLLYGGAGNDSINGGSGDDIIDGGAGDDRIFASTGNDTVVYTLGEGRDTVYGERGVDTLRLQMTSDEANTYRDEIIAYSEWLEQQVADAGGAEAHGNLLAGSTYKFSFGLSVSTVEALEIVVDGEPKTIEEFSVSNTPPAVNDLQQIEGREDEAVEGQIAATDADGDALAYEMISGPANGEVTLDGETGAFVYTPKGDYSGSDSFTVLVSDGKGGTAEQRVELAIAAVADEPSLMATATQQAIQGTDEADVLLGTKGNDEILGGGGNDFIMGDTRKGGDQTFDLDISAALEDVDGSESLEIQVAGVPNGAELSAGEEVGDGVWSVGADDLEGLQLTMDKPTDTTLEITAIATDENGDTATSTASLEIVATGGNDVIDAGAGNDWVFAGYGDDTVTGGEGNDFLIGGRGFDTLDYSAALTGVEANLKTHTARGDNSGFDVLRGFEAVEGSAFDDRLTGDRRDNELSGGDGDDLISGGRGVDVLSGGDGADTFSYSRSDVASGRKHHGVDTITDFDAFDTLDFSGLLRGKQSVEADVFVTETEDGTMISVDMGGRRGVQDVVFLEGVEDFDISQIDDGRGPAPGGNAFGLFKGKGSEGRGHQGDHGPHEQGGHEPPDDLGLLA